MGRVLGKDIAAARARLSPILQYFYLSHELDTADRRNLVSNSDDTIDGHHSIKPATVYGSDDGALWGLLQDVRALGDTNAGKWVEDLLQAKKIINASRVCRSICPRAQPAFRRT